MFCCASLVRGFQTICAFIITVLLVSALPMTASGQAYERDLNAIGKGVLTIKNRTGRVSVIASDNEKDRPKLEATSTGRVVDPGDIIVSGNEISVRERPYRIDLKVRV